LPGHVETEVKLRAPGLSEARSALAQIGATLRRARYLEDNVLWDDPRASLASRGRLLRLRRIPGSALLTFKGPRSVEGGIKSRDEIETSVPDPETLEAILRGVGLSPSFRYQKYREVYSLPDLEIVIDETPIGTFFEIEGEGEAIQKAAAALGYGLEDYISDSYAALFFASGGRGDMVFP
jgi:predicted adenylyl cyclase CyaB